MKREQFGQQIRELGDRLKKGQGIEDEIHFKKIISWYYLFFILGAVTIHFEPNLFTIVCLSTASFARWTIVAHHVCHGGYDFTSSYNRKTFGIGSLLRRMLDWFDWILPEAWNIEHGRLHHYHLNESDDPDLLERNIAGLRRMKIPTIFKYFIVGFLICTWKWFYYASNTYSHLLRGNQDGGNNPKVVTLMSIFTGQTPAWWNTIRFSVHGIGPFLGMRFVFLPAMFYILVNPNACYNVLINLFLAEVVTNIHAFLMIATNHCGSDLTRYNTHADPKSDDFYIHQVMGSVNFNTGSDLNDFFHGFLNYQIEHHLWPDLSLLSYKRAHSEIKEICASHNVPYIQENVFIRLFKTIDIMVGNSSMKRE